MIKRWALSVACLGVLMVLAGVLMQRRLVAAASGSYPQSQEKQAQPPAPPKPGPEMDRLKFLIGTWDYNGEYAKSPMVPQGGKETGWYKAQLGPGGLSIIADFEGDGPIGKEIGHEVLAWAPKENIYKVYTVGNNFPGVLAATARWEGANLVTTSEFTEGASKISLRSVYTDIQEKSVTIEESFQMGDAPYQSLMKSKATKK
jgi:hypothetical protein